MPQDRREADMFTLDEKKSSVRKKNIQEPAVCSVRTHTHKINVYEFTNSGNIAVFEIPFEELRSLLLR